MSDDTTTNSVQPAEAPLEQPTANALETAESLRNDSLESNTNTTTEPEEKSEDNSKPVDELQEWATKKGLDPNDTNAILKSYREAEKKLHEISGKASQLQKQVKSSDAFTDNESVIQEARVLNFYASNPDARAYDLQMGQIVEKFEQSDPVFAEHLLRNLDTLYAMAKVEASSEEIQLARQEGKNEAIKATQKAQSASAPSANAATSKPVETGWNDKRISEVIASGEYDKYRNEILAWEKKQYGI